MPKTVITHCNSCANDTNHIALHSKRRITKIEAENGKVSKEILDYMMLECAGCNSISFLCRESGDFWIDEEGKPDYYDTNYPKRNWPSEYNFMKDEDLDMLPTKIANLYSQVEGVFESDSALLAGIGLRMLVESICIDQKIEARDLQKRIIRLQEEGLISKNELPILDKLREIGNTSAHEIKTMPIDRLGYALDIINHVLKAIYILPKLDKRIIVKKK